MKSATDPRHLSRIKYIEELFSYSFNNKKQLFSTKTTQIISNKNKIDKLIGQAAPEFPINKISKVDLAILRLAIYEILYEKENPPKVIIDEAIELAKEFGHETSPEFINGALGYIYNKKYAKSK
jgi:N utilization substance protein B